MPAFRILFLIRKKKRQNYNYERREIIIRHLPIIIKHKTRKLLPLSFFAYLKEELSLSFRHLLHLKRSNIRHLLHLMHNLFCAVYKIIIFKKQYVYIFVENIT